jgi:hypothetical protein
MAARSDSGAGDNFLQSFEHLILQPTPRSLSF